ncbi:MAG: hypothetical protein R3B93_08500 [Bacteroidia bacterium]
MLWEDSIPVLHEEDANGKKTQVEVVAGTLKGRTAPPPTPDSWAADPNNQVMILTIKIEAGGSWSLPAADASANRTLYFYRGNTLSLDGENLPINHLAQLNADAEVKLTAGGEDLIYCCCRKTHQ